MRNDWLDELQMLLIKFSHLGIEPAGMTITQLWGVYCYLSRLVES